MWLKPRPTIAVPGAAEASGAEGITRHVTLHLATMRRVISLPGINLATTNLLGSDTASR